MRYAELCPEWGWDGGGQFPPDRDWILSEPGLKLNRTAIKERLTFAFIGLCLCPRKEVNDGTMFLVIPDQLSVTALLSCPVLALPFELVR